MGMPRRRSRGREQVVAGEPVLDFFLRIAVVDDLAHQPQHVRVLDLAGHQGLEDFVIQRRKELLHVGFQDIAKTAGELLAASHGGVRAFALAAGVGVGDERPLVDRLQHVDQGVVDHPIPIRGRTDLPLLGFVDEEAAVGSRPVGLGGQFLVQLPQLAFEVEVERGHGGAEAFASAGFLGGTQQRLEANDLFPQRPWRFMLAPQSGWSSLVAGGTQAPSASAGAGGSVLALWACGHSSRVSFLPPALLSQPPTNLPISSNAWLAKP